MRTLAVTTLVVGLAGFAGLARAQDKADPTGTWKWSTMFKEQKREQTLKLKLEEGGKLSGALLGRKDMETKIEDGTFKDGVVSFTISRTRGDRTFVTKYSGKLMGDTIKGTIETERGGEARKQDWEAKRAKE